MCSSVLSLGSNVNTRRMLQPDMGSNFHIKNQRNILRWNLMNLSRGLNPPKSSKTRFKLSAGLNLETLNTILSGTNHI